MRVQGYVIGLFGAASMTSAVPEAPPPGEFIHIDPGCIAANAYVARKPTVRAQADPSGPDVAVPSIVQPLDVGAIALAPPAQSPAAASLGSDRERCTSGVARQLGGTPEQRREIQNKNTP